MRTSFKRFLLLCLLLALPLQGYAAATMLACGLAHGIAPAVVESEPACHEDEPSAPAPASHDCAHCAVCLHASALPIPVVLELTAIPHSPVYAPRPVAILGSHVPDGPERPPRFVPA